LAESSLSSAISDEERRTSIEKTIRGPYCLGRDRHRLEGCSIPAIDTRSMASPLPMILNASGASVMELARAAGAARLRLT
jgi:hypothetical protein